MKRIMIIILLIVLSNLLLSIGMSNITIASLEETTKPIITNITIHEDLETPFDQVAYDSSSNILWYDNIKSEDSIFNITITAIDETGLLSFNTSTEWNDGVNVSVSGLEQTITFNYTISNEETSSGNLTLEIYDSSYNKAEYFLEVWLDVFLPDVWILGSRLDFSEEYFISNCGFMNTTTTDSDSGINGISLTIGGINNIFNESGLNEFCGLPNGQAIVYAYSYDLVGNIRNATNSGKFYIQANYNQSTETIGGEKYDPLDSLKIILDEIYLVVMVVLLGIVGIAFILKFKKN